MDSRTKALRQIFRELTSGVVFYSMLLIVPAIATVLTIAFTRAEWNKVGLLANQVAAVIKPKIQVGDEIEIRGVLSKILETTSVSAISVSGPNISTLEATSVSFPVLKHFSQDSGYSDIFLSPYLVQRSTYSTYPNSDEKFSVQVAFENSVRRQVIAYTAITTIVISIFLFFILLWKLRRARSGIAGPMESLQRYIESFDRVDSEPIGVVDTESLVETRMIKQRFDDLQRRIASQNEELIGRSIEEERGRMASQVGHDLKSYTSILLQSIQRIRSKIGDEDLMILKKAASEIAAKMQELNRLGSSSLSQEERSFPVQISACVANLVELKALEYAERPDVRIRFKMAESDIQPFVKVDPIEFGRAFSNLINNAVEASSGAVEIGVSIRRSGACVLISIEDNGVGISGEQLSQVTKEGFSTKTGVNRGNGLPNAVQIVRRDGGELAIESQLGRGTTVVMKFLETVPRNSAVSHLDLSEFRRVIIVDNDRDFGERVTEILRKKSVDIRIESVSSVEEFRKFCKDTTLNEEDLLLMDYDLGDATTFGDDLVLETGFLKQSILLTHNYTNARLLNKCDVLGLRLLPKILFERALGEVEKKHVDAIVIEDDELQILSLRKLGETHGLRFKFYQSVSSFMVDANRVNREVLLIVDSKLKDGEQGEVGAKTLFDEFGFRNIVLNTGFQREHFAEQFPKGLYWIKEFVQKDPKRLLQLFPSAGQA